MNQRLDGIDELLQLFGRDPPNLVQIHVVVGMHQDVAHPGYLPPRDSRVKRLELVRKSLRRFSDHEELPNNRVLTHRLAIERLVRDALDIAASETGCREDIGRGIPITRHALLARTRG